MMKDSAFQLFSLFACWFQPELISHGTIFSSHNKPAPAGLISPETNQQAGCLIRVSRSRLLA